MEPLIILGAGTMAQEVTDLAEDIGTYEVIGYAVDRDWQPGMRLLDRPVWRWDQLPACHCQIAGAIFSPERRVFIERVEALGFRWASLIHPSASVSRTAQIGVGVVINRLAVVSAHARIGQHVLINRGALIGHHTIVESFCTIGPGVNIAGQCRIALQTTIGMGAIVVEKSTILGGKIRAGSLVMGEYEGMGC